MKQFYLLDNSGELKTSIQLDGNFVIAYSLRLWRTDDKVLDIVEDIRGSCFNKESKTICYYIANFKELNYSYFLELDANISTIHTKADYAIKLSLEQKIGKDKWSFLGTNRAYGNVSCNKGGVFSNIRFSLLSQVKNEIMV